jgi:antitoxin (DNA-binding transcriptional repressor) of toxin-antitoxin stability system
MNATIVDLRYRMKEVLRAIDRGETVNVLYRGKEKARLMPVSAASSAAEAGAARTGNQPIFGLWKDRDDLTDPAAWVRNLRQPRAVPARSGIKPPRAARKPK